MDGAIDACAPIESKKARALTARYTSCE